MTPTTNTLVNGHAPPRPGPAFEVIRLRAGQSLEGIVLSAVIWGYMTHWIKRGKTGYSIECTKGKQTCPCDSEELPTRRKGYFHVFDLQRSREAFLELTTAVAEQVLKWETKEGSYRGYRFKASRGKGADNSRLTFSFSNPYPVREVESYPQAKDPRPYLELLWRLAKPETE